MPLARFVREAAIKAAEQGWHMQWSEQRDQIAPALVRAQSKIAGAEKRSKNPGLRNDYADLDSVWTMIGPALQGAGLAVIRAPSIRKSTL